MKSLKLTVEPVPVTSAGKSLSRMLPMHRWDKIRQNVYAESGYQCAICGVEPKIEPRWVSQTPEQTLVQRALFGRIEPLRRRRRLECHEVWEYDEAARVQRLARLVALCTLCHQVKHWPRARTRLLDGEVHKGRGSIHLMNEERFARYMRGIGPNITVMEAYFLEINKCDLKTMKEHVEQTAEVCFQRSQFEWQVDFGEYAEPLEPSSIGHLPRPGTVAHHTAPEQSGVGSGGGCTAEMHPSRLP